MLQVMPQEAIGISWMIGPSQIGIRFLYFVQVVCIESVVIRRLFKQHVSTVSTVHNTVPIQWIHGDFTWWWWWCNEGWGGIWNGWHAPFLEHAQIYTQCTRGEKRQQMNEKNGRASFSANRNVHKTYQKWHKKEKGTETHTQIIKNHQPTNNGQKRQSTDMDYEL